MEEVLLETLLVELKLCRACWVFWKSLNSLVIVFVSMCWLLVCFV